LIYDSNDNGKWDTGDYLKKIQPEKVEYFSEPEITTNSSVTTQLQWSLKARDRTKEVQDDTDEDET